MNSLCIILFNEFPRPATLCRIAAFRLRRLRGLAAERQEWVEHFDLVYMPLVVTAYDVPRVDVLLISGGVRSDEDLYNLRRAVKSAKKVVAVGTCAISGGVANLGNRDEVRELFMSQNERRHLPRLLPKSQPVDDFVECGPLSARLPAHPGTFHGRPARTRRISRPPRPSARNAGAKN